MVQRILLIVGLLLLAGSPAPMLASQEPGDSQLRYIEEFKERNISYGPGCNGIGISTSALSDLPAEVSNRWVAGHSACIPGLRLVMACIGETTGEDRVLGCSVQAADGQFDESIDCGRFTLITPAAQYEADPRLSDALSAGADDERAQSCSTEPSLPPGAIVTTAFIVPEAESAGDLALMIDLDGSELPVFLIPASQIGLATPIPS